MAKSEKHWLQALDDRVAGLHVHQRASQLADVQRDNDWEFLVATPDKKLKLFKNSEVKTQVNLLDVPTALCAFTMDRMSPLMSVAVSAGPYVFVYRNLRPYFKFKVPEAPINLLEKNLWEGLVKESSPATVSQAKEKLKHLRDQDREELHVRSQQLLALENPEEAQEFVQRISSTPLQRHTVVTCLASIKRNSLEKSECEHLIVGTEAGQVLVLGVGAKDVENEFHVSDAPIAISTSGIWETECRITIACRNGVVHTIRNKKKVNTLFDVGCSIVDIRLIQNELFVACSDGSLQCYHAKGRKLWTIKFSQKICALTCIDIDTMSACVVGFDNGNVKVVNNEGKEVLRETGEDKGQVAISALHFGRFGREDNCLVMVLRNGGIKVNIVPRRVVAADHSVNSYEESETLPLDVPKKTRLYVEQTQREQSEYMKMHQFFQKGLCKLRLETVRAYSKLVSTGHSFSVTTGKSKKIGLNVRIQGIGPNFLLLVEVTNQGNESAAGTRLTFKFNDEIYIVNPVQLNLPVLVPHMTFTHAINVTAMEAIRSGQIFTLLSDSENDGAPLVSAIVKMPLASEV